MAHSVGLEPVSQCVQAELFSTDIRSVGSGVVGVFSGLTIAATGFLLPLMLEAWGFSGMFFAFAAVALVSFVFGYFVLPESKQCCLRRSCPSTMALERLGPRLERS